MAQRVLHLAELAKAQAPSAAHFRFRQGATWKHAILMPNPGGPGGLCDERVVLRANEHFPHDALLAYIAAAADGAQELALAVLAAAEGARPAVRADPPTGENHG